MSWRSARQTSHRHVAGPVGHARARDGRRDGHGPNLTRRAVARRGRKPCPAAAARCGARTRARTSSDRRDRLSRRLASRICPYLLLSTTAPVLWRARSISAPRPAAARARGARFSSRSQTGTSSPTAWPTRGPGPVQRRAERGGRSACPSARLLGRGVDHGAQRVAYGRDDVAQRTWRARERTQSAVHLEQAPGAFRRQARKLGSRRHDEQLSRSIDAGAFKGRRRRASASKSPSAPSRGPGERPAAGPPARAGGDVPGGCQRRRKARRSGPGPSAPPRQRPALRARGVPSGGREPSGCDDPRDVGRRGAQRTLPAVSALVVAQVPGRAPTPTRLGEVGSSLANGCRRNRQDRQGRASPDVDDVEAETTTRRNTAPSAHREGRPRAEQPRKSGALELMWAR